MNSVNKALGNSAGIINPSVIYLDLEGCVIITQSDKQYVGFLDLEKKISGKCMPILTFYTLDESRKELNYEDTLQLMGKIGSYIDYILVGLILRVEGKEDSIKIPDELNQSLNSLLRNHFISEHTRSISCVTAIKDKRVIVDIDLNSNLFSYNVKGCYVTLKNQPNIIFIPTATYKGFGTSFSLAAYITNTSVATYAPTEISNYITHDMERAALSMILHLRAGHTGRCDVGEELANNDLKEIIEKRYEDVDDFLRRKASALEQHEVRAF